MGWSQGFKTALKHAPSIVPRYRLRFLYIGPHGPISGDLTIDSDGSSFGGGARILVGSVNVQGTTVTPQTWNVSFGGFTVGILGDIRKFSAYVPRGVFAQLECDLGTGYERIAIGQLKNIRIENPRYYLQFADLISSLQCGTDTRADVIPSPTTRAKSIIFRGCGIETTLTVNYNVAHTSLSVNNLDLFQQETGENGHVRLTDGASIDFVLSWDGKGVGTLTSLATQYVYPSTQIRNDVSIADGKIYPIAVLPGFPGEILGKIILSTGTGGNGPLDVYPEEWSVGASMSGGVFDQDVFDHADVLEQKNNVITLANQIPNYAWKVAIETEMSAGLRTFASIAASCGQWPVFRQGAVSWRGCVDPYGNSAYNNVVTTYNIGDRDIISIDSHDLYNPQNPNNYVWLDMIYGETLTATSNLGLSYFFGSNVKSIPSIPQLDIDNRFVYSGDPYSHMGDRLAQATPDMERMLGYLTYTHEKLALTVNIYYASMCAGDIVSITSSRIWGLCEAEGETYSDRLGMVLSVQFNISRRIAKITVAVLPTQNYRNQ